MLEEGLQLDTFLMTSCPRFPCQQPVWVREARVSVDALDRCTVNIYGTGWWSNPPPPLTHTHPRTSLFEFPHVSPTIKGPSHDIQPKVKEMVDSLTMISGRTRLLQLGPNHPDSGGEWSNASVLLKCHHSPGQRHQHQGSRGFLRSPLPRSSHLSVCSPLSGEITDVSVTRGTSASPRHLHLLVDAAIPLPLLLHSAKCQTVWQHQRSVWTSSGTLF